MTRRDVIVLGGGIGGTVAARMLRRRLPKGVRVRLIDQDSSSTFAPSLLWMLSGERSLEQITRDRARIRRAGIDVIDGRATRIDIARKVIGLDGDEVSFDRLVIALGFQPDPSLMPGLADGGLDIYSAEGATAAGHALEEFEGGRVVVLLSKLPYKCPAAPNEAAFLVEALLRRKGIAASVALFTPEPFPMPTAGEALGTALANMLTSRGIELHAGAQAEAVDAGSRELVMTTGERVGYDLLLAIPPHRTSQVVAASGLTNEAGFVPVDANTLATQAEGVYAIGDVTQIPIAGGKFLPKAGVFAKAQAQVVAKRIADEMAGDTPSASFDGKGACFVDMGDGVAAFAAGDFYAPEGPAVKLRKPSRRHHLAKVAVEKYWLARWA